MTVKDMILKALTMLGYLDHLGRLAGEAERLERGKLAVNQIYSDLVWRTKELACPNGGAAPGDTGAADSSGADCPAELGLSDAIPLPARLLSDVMPYGVAMLLAEGESDADNQSRFAAIYNQKRVATAHSGSVADALPRGGY